MDKDYDVIIAGAGIVGLATGLMILQKRPKTRLLILDKEDGVARHQTGHNSGVIHSGIYYKPGSLKAKNCITGYKRLIEFCNEENIPYEICGKVIVATSESELGGLNALYDKGIANGLDRIRKIDKAELKEIEPYANGIKAIHVPYTGIIDYKTVSEKFANKITGAGGRLKFLEKIVKVKETSAAISVETKNSSFTTKNFINCCGLQSDDVAKISGDGLYTRIIPFRGEYYKIRKEKRYLLKNLIYPVPDPAFPFLGVHFTRMLNGEAEAGPNAVLAFKKEGYSKTSFSLSDTFKTFTWGGFYRIAGKYMKTGLGEFYRSYYKKAFVKALQRLMPEITSGDLVPGGSGVRAQAIDKNGKAVDDFIINERGNIINVLNAPSPAATSSLSIGDTISEKIINRLN